MHIGANPGLNERMEQFYASRLNVAPPHLKLPFQIKTQDLAAVKAESMTEEELEAHQKRVLQATNLKQDEVCKYIKNKRLKPLLCRQDVSLRSQGRDLTLTRILGHRSDVPGSGQWRMLTN